MCVLYHKGSKLSLQKLFLNGIFIEAHLLINTFVMFNNQKIMIMTTNKLATDVAVTERLTIPQAQDIFASSEINPANIAISNDGRIFATMNPLTSPDVKVCEVINDFNVVPFPDAYYAMGEDSEIRGAIGINVDQNNCLWILDMQGREFFVWNLDNHALDRRFLIDAAVCHSNSFLQDFVIDRVRGRVIIADMTLADDESKAAPAFIVIDMDTLKMQRVLENHPALCSTVKGGFDLNPIAIDPQCEWLYFGAIHSHRLYRMPLEAFVGESIDYLEDTIDEFAPKPYCDGIEADDKENVYITNVEQCAIGVCNKGRYRDIATLPQSQSWPDGLALHDGYVYCAVSQLDRAPAMNDGEDRRLTPYVIVRTPMVDINRDSCDCQ